MSYRSLGDVVAPPIAVPADAGVQMVSVPDSKGIPLVVYGPFLPAFNDAMKWVDCRIEHALSYGWCPTAKNNLYAPVMALRSLISLSTNVAALQALGWTAFNYHVWLATYAERYGWTPGKEGDALGFGADSLDSGDIASLNDWGNQLAAAQELAYKRIVALKSQPSFPLKVQQKPFRQQYLKTPSGAKMAAHMPVGRRGMKFR